MYIPKYFSYYIIIILALAVTKPVLAQSDSQANTGSFYSGIGFGSPVDIASPHSMGMGLSGVSNYTGFSPSISNPAHWGLISYSQGNLSGSLDHYNAVDSNSSARNALLAIDGFQIAFPILRNRLGFSSSFTPTVRNDFRQVNQGFFDPIPGVPTEFDEIEYQVATVGSGGINRFEAGLGFRVTNFMSLGYAFSANLLTINNDIFSAFSSTQYSPAQYNRRIDGNSFGHRFGIYAYSGNIFRNDDQIAIGATISLPMNFDSEESITTFRTVNGQRTRIELNEDSAERFGNTKLPLEFNTGLTYNLSRFVNVNAEVLIQRWDKAEYSFNPTQEEYYNDRVRAGFGIQYHPYRLDQVGGFLSNLKYSIGTTFDNGHLSINGENIETIFLNAGIGLMTQRSPSSIDLSFHYGLRGTDSSNLVKENIWGFKLSLNLAEFMFLRQRFQ